jgi:hypothetical protein
MKDAQCLTARRTGQVTDTFVPDDAVSKRDKMINGLWHVPAGVLDQESAKTIYTEKLGFELKTDRRTEVGCRWIGVCAAHQADVKRTENPKEATHA